MARRVDGIWVCTLADLDDLLTPLEYRKFKKWINGQTGMILETGEFTYYLHDVERFIKLYRHGVKTYFD
jgi:hypothetical protein